MSNLTHRVQSIANCHVSLWEGGRGHPLLFLHGSQGVPRPPPFLDSLCEKFHVIVPEHPGFGLSETPCWLANIRDLAYFYLGFMEAMELRSVHVVGQAIGGWIAAETAVCSTERMASLAIAGAPGLRSGAARPIDVFSMSDDDLARHLFHSSDLAAAVAVRSSGFSTAQRRINDKNKRTLAQLARRPFFHDPHLHKWLHRIKIPTLIMWGADDRAVPREIGEAYHELIPNSEMLLLEACGHLPHVERPVEYVAALVSFIDGLPADSLDAPKLYTGAVISERNVEPSG